MTSLEEVPGTLAIDALAARLRLSFLAGIRYYEIPDGIRATLFAWALDEEGNRWVPQGEGTTADAAVLDLYAKCVKASRILVPEIAHESGGREFEFNPVMKAWYARG